MVYAWGRDSLGPLLLRVFGLENVDEFGDLFAQYVFGPRLVGERLRNKHAVAISMNSGGTTLVVTNEGIVYNLRPSRATLRLHCEPMYIRVGVIDRDEPGNGAIDFVQN